MPLVQDQSLDLLTSSPTCYHCTTDASSSVERKKGLTTSHLHTQLDPFACELTISLKTLLGRYCGVSVLLVIYNKHNKNMSSVSCLYLYDLIYKLKIIISYWILMLYDVNILKHRLGFCRWVNSNNNI